MDNKNYIKCNFVKYKIGERYKINEKTNFLDKNQIKNDILDDCYDINDNIYKVTKNETYFKIIEKLNINELKGLNNVLDKIINIVITHKFISNIKDENEIIKLLD